MEAVSRKPKRPRDARQSEKEVLTGWAALEARKPAIFNPHRMSPWDRALTAFLSGEEGKE